MKSPTPPLIRVLSLGAGVQSTTLWHLYQTKKLKRPPDFCIFANTQREPKYVYDVVKRIKRESKIPIYEISKGDIYYTPNKIPYHLKKEKGLRGMNQRQCTQDYKIVMVDKKIREVLGYKKHQKMRHKIEIIIGFSLDEKRRVSVPIEKWKKFSYPLIENGITRLDCENYLSKVNFSVNRSACIMCPFRSDSEWLYLKENNPDLFEEACRYDEMIRTEEVTRTHNLKYPQYMHKSMIPLRDVDFANELELRKQGDFFELLGCSSGFCGL